VNINALLVNAALAVALNAAAFAVQAEEAQEPETGWSGLVGFSFADARGNTDTLAVTGDASFNYLTATPWRYDGAFQFVNREEDGVRTEERYEARGSANYFITEENYLYGRLSWRKDNFGAVEEEWLPSVGYGRVLLHTERHKLNGEVGVGYRFADLADGTSEDGVAATTGLLYTWQISETAVFTQNALAEWTSDNTYLESETGIRVIVVGNLSARATYRVRHNTDVPVGTRNSDFLTTIGLDYKF